MAIARAPQNKAVVVPENKAAEQEQPYPVPLLLGGHGQRLCTCGRVLASCFHFGHGHINQTIQESCNECRG